MKKVLLTACIALALALAVATAAQADPTPRSLYGKCIKENGGIYHNGRWYPQSMQSGMAARDCLDRLTLKKIRK
jgi:hypothetical protein